LFTFCCDNIFNSYVGENTRGKGLGGGVIYQSSPNLCAGFVRLAVHQSNLKKTNLSKEM